MKCPALSLRFLIIALTISCNQTQGMDKTKTGQRASMRGTHIRAVSTGGAHSEHLKKYLETISSKDPAKEQKELDPALTSRSSSVTATTDTSSPDAPYVSTPASEGLKRLSKKPASLPSIPTLSLADLSAEEQQVTEGLQRISARRTSLSLLHSPRKNPSEALTVKKEEAAVSHESTESMLAQLPREIPGTPVLKRRQSDSALNAKMEESKSPTSRSRTTSEQSTSPKLLQSLPSSTNVDKKSHKSRRFSVTRKPAPMVPSLRMDSVTPSLATESPIRSHIRAKSAAGILTSPRFEEPFSGQLMRQHEALIAPISIALSLAAKERAALDQAVFVKASAAVQTLKDGMKIALSKFDEEISAQKRELALSETKIAVLKRTVEELESELATAQTSEQSAIEERNALLHLEDGKAKKLKGDISRREDTSLIKDSMFVQWTEQKKEIEFLRSELAKLTAPTLLDPTSAQAKIQQLVEIQEEQKKQLELRTQELESLQEKLALLMWEREREKALQQAVLDKFDQQKKAYEHAVEQTATVLDKIKSHEDALSATLHFEREKKEQLAQSAKKAEQLDTAFETAAHLVSQSATQAREIERTFQDSAATLERVKQQEAEALQLRASLHNSTYNNPDYLATIEQAQIARERHEQQQAEHRRLTLNLVATQKKLRELLPYFNGAQQRAQSGQKSSKASSKADKETIENYKTLQEEEKVLQDALGKLDEELTQEKIMAQQGELLKKIESAPALSFSTLLALPPFDQGTSFQPIEEEAEEQMLALHAAINAEAFAREQVIGLTTEIQKAHERISELKKLLATESQAAAEHSEKAAEWAEKAEHDADSVKHFQELIRTKQELKEHKRVAERWAQESMKSTHELATRLENVRVAQERLKEINQQREQKLEQAKKSEQAARARLHAYAAEKELTETRIREYQRELAQQEELIQSHKAELHAAQSEWQECHAQRESVREQLDDAHTSPELLKLLEQEQLYAADILKKLVDEGDDQSSSEHESDTYSLHEKEGSYLRQHKQRLKLSNCILTFLREREATDLLSVAHLVQDSLLALDKTYQKSYLVHQESVAEDESLAAWAQHPPKLFTAHEQDQLITLITTTHDHALLEEFARRASSNALLFCMSNPLLRVLPRAQESLFNADPHHLAFCLVENKDLVEPFARKVSGEQFLETIQGQEQLLILEPVLRRIMKLDDKHMHALLANPLNSAYLPHFNGLPSVKTALSKIQALNTPGKMQRQSPGEHLSLALDKSHLAQGAQTVPLEQLFLAIRERKDLRDNPFVRARIAHTDPVILQQLLLSDPKVADAILKMLPTMAFLKTIAGTPLQIRKSAQEKLEQIDAYRVRQYMLKENNPFYLSQHLENPVLRSLIMEQCDKNAHKIACSLYHDQKYVPVSKSRNSASAVTHTAAHRFELTQCDPSNTEQVLDFLKKNSPAACMQFAAKFPFAVQYCITHLIEGKQYIDSALLYKLAPSISDHDLHELLHSPHALEYLDNRDIQNNTIALTFLQTYGAQLPQAVLSKLSLVRPNSFGMVLPSFFGSLTSTFDIRELDAYALLEFSKANSSVLQLLERRKVMSRLIEWLFHSKSSLDQDTLSHLISHISNDELFTLLNSQLGEMLTNNKTIQTRALEVEFMQQYLCKLPTTLLKKILLTDGPHFAHASLLLVNNICSSERLCQLLALDAAEILLSHPDIRKHCTAEPFVKDYLWQLPPIKLAFLWNGYFEECKPIMAPFLKNCEDDTLIALITLSDIFFNHPLVQQAFLERGLYKTHLSRITDEHLETLMGSHREILQLPQIQERILSQGNERLIEELLKDCKALMLLTAMKTVLENYDECYQQPHPFENEALQKRFMADDLREVFMQLAPAPISIKALYAHPALWSSPTAKAFITSLITAAMEHIPLEQREQLAMMHSWVMVLEPLFATYKDLFTKHNFHATEFLPLIKERQRYQLVEESLKLFNNTMACIEGESEEAIALKDVLCNWCCLSLEQAGSASYEQAVIDIQKFRYISSVLSNKELSLLIEEAKLSITGGVAPNAELLASFSAFEQMAYIVGMLAYGIYRNEPERFRECLAQLVTSQPIMLTIPVRVSPKVSPRPPQGARLYFQQILGSLISYAKEESQQALDIVMEGWKAADMLGQKQERLETEIEKLVDQLPSFINKDLILTISKNLGTVPGFYAERSPLRQLLALKKTGKTAGTRNCQYILHVAHQLTEQDITIQSLDHEPFDILTTHFAIICKKWQWSEQSEEALDAFKAMLTECKSNAEKISKKLVLYSTTIPYPIKHWLETENINFVETRS